MRVLIVEDEKNLAEALGEILAGEHYSTDIVYNGRDGLDFALSGQYDAIVLDVMLPLKSGFEVVRELRESQDATPVLLLTAREEIGDKVEGLDCGADDYMTKPFAPQELLARLRAITRRQGDVVLDVLRFGDLNLNVSNYELQRGEKSVHLGYKEFEVLKMLLSNPKIVLSKDEIISKIWGLESNAEDNNVEAYISFLRKKLNYLGSSVSIMTIRKVGYRLEGEQS